MSKLALSHEPSAVSKTVSSVRFPVPRLGARLNAVRGFGIYKPEEKHEVRSLKLGGDEHQRLQRTKQMLRSMAPEQVFEIIEFHRDLSFFESLAIAKREGKLIVPNDVYDRILT